MEFSPQQQKAIDAVMQWIADPGDNQVFRLFGYAGTGKTTLAKYIASRVEEEHGGDVLFGAFTGKAALVLQRKGCEGASTLHSLIYNVKEGDDGPVFVRNRESPLAEATLLIVDECSMVAEELGEDVLSFETPVLVLGDPAQLPPVSGAGFFTHEEKGKNNIVAITPDVMLTEIHRQARDNPIIALATEVRLGRRLKPGRYGESEVRDRPLSREIVLRADQLIVGKNATRNVSNRKYRKLLKRESWHPVEGDRLVCLQNKKDLGLLNGGLWECVELGDYSANETIEMEIKSLDFDAPNIEVQALSGYFQSTSFKPEAWQFRRFSHFDFGYALTCHKAQGSQWDDVAIIDESGVFREDAERWLYTAITRAAVRVTIARAS